MVLFTKGTVLVYACFYFSNPVNIGFELNPPNANPPNSNLQNGGPW